MMCLIAATVENQIVADDVEISEHHDPLQLRLHQLSLSYPQIWWVQHIVSERIKHLGRRLNKSLVDESWHHPRRMWMVGKSVLHSNPSTLFWFMGRGRGLGAEQGCVTLARLGSIRLGTLLLTAWCNNVAFITNRRCQSWCLYVFYLGPSHHDIFTCIVWILSW